MKNALLNEKLERERTKLNKLADKAWRRGVPLIQDKEFLLQNQKVDALVLKYYEKNINRQGSAEKSLN
ncbi:hypothetical protein [Desulfitobacterium chlororespirans]|uniref:Spo0E like sporulation regulatory protein n=1 Tax=Desulfitobacterium chlororespirans DSM 11544 TaxID=1121395 RepID=A0A1M7S152_9FIRM|nr:hypothetical protein [Desulfitobacterium chlororespirans]SHN52074.1 hypothetical protein SAMN02745215_00355 [Desulfitobacterium chlororespirans DSM 11544]